MRLPRCLGAIHLTCHAIAIRTQGSKLTASAARGAQAHPSMAPSRHVSALHIPDVAAGLTGVQILFSVIAGPVCLAAQRAPSPEPQEWSDKGFTQGCWGGALGLNHLEYVRPAEPYPMPPPECLSVVDGLLSAGEEDLRAMVRTYARGAAPEGMAEVLACMALEAAPGQTFPASFSAAATLGVVSPRQITEDAASGPSWQKGTPAAVAAEVGRGDGATAVAWRGVVWARRQKRLRVLGTGAFI